MLAVAAILCSGLAWGISGAIAADESPPASDGKVVLKLGTVNDPDSLNPFVGYESTSYEVWSLNYDFVIGYGTKDGAPEGKIAESWSVSPDGKVWTFKIRQGMTWQDGEPVTAKDVAFTYNYIVQKDLAAYSSYTKLIKEAKAVDDYTCEVTCSKPKANMERLWIYVFPEHIWGKIDKPEKYKMTYPIIGSGPFQCVEWKKGNFVRLEKNPNYWGGAPTVDEIILQTYTNEDTMVQELKSGLIDGAAGIPPVQYDAMGKTAGFAAYKYNLFLWDYLAFNCYDQPTSRGNPALKDVAFRQALNWAIDKDKLVQIAYNGLSVPGTSQMPPGEWPANFDAHYQPTPEELYSFDLEKAKTLLDEAGYMDKNGDGMREDKNGKPLKLRLWARSEAPSTQKMGKLIAGWFGDVGLKIEFSVMDDGAISDKLYAYDDNCSYAPDYDMYIWDYWGYADPGDSLASFTTAQIEWWNDSCWSNAEFDKLCDQQFSQVDKTQRLETIHKMQQIMYVDSPQVVLGYPYSLEAVNTDKWEGWTQFMNGGVFFLNYNVESYINLKPKAGSESESSGISSITWIAIIAVVVAVVIVAIVVILRRRTPRAVEE